MKASITFFPNKTKKNRKTGKFPMYMRICYQRTKAESRLNAEISAVELLTWDPLTMRLLTKNSDINHQLNRLHQKFNDFILLNSTSLPKYSAAYIKDYVLGTNLSKQISVVKFVDDYFVNAVVNNINRKPGTIKTYRRAINHLNRFLDIRKQKNLTFDDLDYAFASDFKNYLVRSIPTEDKVGMTEISCSGVIKKFRTIFSQAVDLELLKQNPFKLVKIKTKSPRRERLTIQQLKEIWHLDLTNYPSQVVHKDIFLFSVFTGLAYHDALSLTWSDLEERVDGNIKLSICRQKSEILTECFLPSYAIEIAKRYLCSEETEISKKVLPNRSNQKINSQLKFIANLARIPFRLTTHIARHTFRQLLSEAGISDYAVIKRMMGHSGRTDIDEIYYCVTEKRLLEARGRFESFLIQNLTP